MNIFTLVVTYTVFLPMMFAPVIKPEESKLGGYFLDVQTMVPHQWGKIDSRWAEGTESSNGVYDWTYLDRAVGKIRAAGGFVMINIHRTPDWARTSPYKCHLPDDLFYLRRFAKAIIDRYHPEYLEFWNEPEMSQETATSLQSCCGCLYPNEYRLALNDLYTNVVNNTDTKLVAGAFLFDWPWIQEFFESGPVAADVISYHHYNYGLDTSPTSLLIERGLLQGYTSIPIILTETSLICDKCAPQFRDYQALWMYEVNKHDFPLVIWYSQDNVGWRFCNLTSSKGFVKYPAFYALKDIVESPWWLP